MPHEQMAKMCKIHWDGRPLPRDHKMVGIAQRLLSMEEDPTSHAEVVILVRQGRIEGVDWTEKERYRRQQAEQEHS